MIVVRALGATFADPRGDVVGPFDAVVHGGTRFAIDAPTTRAASIAARMFAGIVKPTTGTIYVGDFDTRLQPPEAKRRCGFVDARGFLGDRHAFACEAAFRAEVWGLDVAETRARADAILERFGDPLDPYARAVALALAPGVTFAVLDQPSEATTDTVAEAFPQIAVIATHVGARVASVDVANAILA